MFLVELRLSLYSSKSPSWYSDYPFTHHSLPGGSDNPYTHHSLPGGTQRISIRFTVSLVVLRIPLYSSLSPWWYSDYPYISLLTTVYLVAQTIPIFITVSLLVLRESLYASQSLWWYSEYPYTHHCLPGGTQTIPILITVSLMILRLSHIPLSKRSKNP